MAKALPSDYSKDDYLRLREIESDTQGGHHYKHLRRVRLCSKPCNPTHDAVRLGEKERKENVLNPFSISLTIQYTLQTFLTCGARWWH